VAIFVGGCTIDAAEVVAVGQGSGPLSGGAQYSQLEDALASLVDKSLLRQVDNQDGERRFWMLETIREYGLEQLDERGELGELQERHADYYLALVERAEPELRGRDQALWLEQLNTELDNLRAALQT